MNIKQLNERLNALLEISDELKQRVFQKRKEQVDLAQKKLNKSAELIAKSNKNIKQEIEITFLRGDLNITETNIVDGAFGDIKNYTETNHRYTGIYNISNISSFVNELTNNFCEYISLWWIKPNDITYDITYDNTEDRLTCTLLGDEDWEEPTEQDLEDYRNNNRNLFIIDGFVEIEISGEDKPFFIQALKDAGIKVI